MDGEAGTYVAIAATGIVHGLEPGHGWPLAVLLSRRQHRSVGFASSAALVLGLGHLVSSFAAVAFYLALDQAVDFSSDVFRFVGAGLLLALAVKMWRERPAERANEHQRVLTLASLTWVALVLGFAHEEEFMLLGLAVGGVDPLLMMTAYALAVVFSMLSVTLVAYGMFERFQSRFGRVVPYLPKVTALVLVVLSVLLLADIY